jgi:hypothetical protein
MAAAQRETEPSAVTVAARVAVGTNISPTGCRSDAVVY